jgi:hypothetical protein
MPITSNPVAISDVANELGFALSNVNMDTTIFAVSNLAAQPSAGNFHNIQMGQAQNDTFANKIWYTWDDPTTYGGMPLGNWLGYNHDAPYTFTGTIANNSASEYDAYIYVNTALSGVVGQYGPLNLPPGTPPTNFTPVVAGLNGARTEGDYSIYIRIMRVIQLGPANLNIVSYVDSDGVGAGTARDVNAFYQNWDFLSQGDIFQDWIIAYDPFAGLIPWNKRTTWDIQIN